MDIGCKTIVIDSFENGIGGGPLHEISFSQKRNALVAKKHCDEFIRTLGIGVFVGGEHRICIHARAKCALQNIAKLINETFVFFCLLPKCYRALLLMQ